MLKWDELDLSWINIDMLGCLLQNDESHTVVIHAKRFVLHPETHYNQVHEVPTVSVSVFLECHKSVHFWCPFLLVIMGIVS